MTGRPITVLRLGEVFLKGRNRSWFLKKLVDNAKRISPNIQLRHSRIICTDPVPPEEFTRLFGITSISPAREISQNLDEAADAAVELLSDLRPESFKVEAVRSDKSFPVKSPDIARQVGGEIAERTGLRVDVHDPHTVVLVEIGRELSFVSAGRIPGPGGLPVGVSGRGILLLSGGIDSPVAGSMMLKRGMDVVPLCFHAPPYTDDRLVEKLTSLARRLHDWGGSDTMYLANFTEVQKILRYLSPGKLTIIRYRRMMMRVASLLAERLRAQTIITGESLGQVASQTIQNMTAIEDAARLPVMRPLIGLDKEEIIKRAKKLGSYEISIIPQEDTCTLFAPPSPETKAKLEVVEKSESSVDVWDMARSLVDSLEEVHL